MRLIHPCSGVWLTSLPPKWPNQFKLSFNRFQRKPWLGNYGGFGGYGIRYGWLWLCVWIGRQR